MAAQPDRAGDRELSEAVCEDIRVAVRGKYSRVARSAAGRFTYPTGREGALRLGYDAALLASIPAELLSSFCGVGNPFTLGTIAPGSAVLDIGCGAGFDLVVASRLTGAQGRVCGLDLTAEMLERARAVLAALGLDQVETILGTAERIPSVDDCFDVVISNGVINLSPQKAALFREIYRVLKPGGRLQFADIILDKPLPAAMASSLEAWTQ